LAEYQLPETLRYTREDEWLRPAEDGSAVVGISDYAQQQLGDVVFVELPEPGAVLQQGQPCGAIESVKTVAELFAPVSGEVTRCNQDLAQRPEAVNEDCYGDGWLLAIAPSQPAELDGLLDAAAYAQHIADRE